jgi:hypothetical protein
MFYLWMKTTDDMVSGQTAEVVRISDVSKFIRLTDFDPENHRLYQIGKEVRLEMNLVPVSVGPVFRSPGVNSGSIRNDESFQTS